MPNTGVLISGVLIASLAPTYQYFGPSAGSARQTKARPTVVSLREGCEAVRLHGPSNSNVKRDQLMRRLYGRRVRISYVVMLIRWENPNSTYHGDILGGESWPMVILTKQRITGIII